ncbi:TOX high mobility group box family member 3-like isoform X2 [Argiope bruennichi]|uniref:TOX high mobility group box family member 3-like isoform X2 n=1 Tax=Argiope bruennichi TaxID=94029 RepID=UPI00249453DB|nr:TOX high mobility group box family member 3-like isoform X2 [Argiope bruennichi]
MAQMYESYMYKSVDNFDLAMAMNGNGQENGDGYIDHTFHTPSFGDEEFDIPPISLPPTTPGSDTSSSDVYGSTQPLSHQDQPTQQQQQQQQQSTNNNQQHLMSPPPQMSPSPCSQTSSMDRIGPVMTAITTTPSPPTMMTSFSGSPHHHHQQQQQQQHHQVSHVQQQQQQQISQHQQQQHQYGNHHPNDMYMLQIAPGSMMPPQSVQFHVQQYAIPTSYSNGPMQQSHLHMAHAQQQQQQHPQVHHHPVPHQQQQQQHHIHPHHHQLHHQQQLLPPSPMLALQLGAPRHQRPGSVGSSPPGSNHTSPGLETSEDSDDSGHLSQLICGMKRPSPEPVERPPSAGKPIKKPKVQKKKKKRDPNEPQKPVSAYALFFRDTQAAIKGQNPNASFGEVSKIVASMWDGLDIDHKNVYKKKTEAAKKEYLKALAAYRASLVSKAANDQSDNIYGSNGPNGSTPTSMSTSMSAQSLSPLQKKSPLLTSLMEGTQPSGMQTMSNQQSLLMGQNPMNGVHHPHMMPQHMSPHSSTPPSHQILHQMLSPGAQQQQQQMMHMGSPPPPSSHMMQQHHNMQMASLNNNNNNISYTPNMSPQLTHQQAQQQQQQQQQGMMCTSPLQNSCSRGGEAQQDWERDYCNNDCVVSHCRDVFTTWVAARPPQSSYASVK